MHNSIAADEAQGPRPNTRAHLLDRQYWSCRKLRVNALPKAIAMEVLDYVGFWHFVTGSIASAAGD